MSLLHDKRPAKRARKPQPSTARTAATVKPHDGASPAPVPVVGSSTARPSMNGLGAGGAGAGATPGAPTTASTPRAAASRHHQDSVPPAARTGAGLVWLWDYGRPAGRGGAYLTVCGFEDVSKATVADLRRLLFPELLPGRHVRFLCPPLEAVCSENDELLWHRYKEGYGSDGDLWIAPDVEAVPRHNEATTRVLDVGVWHLMWVVVIQRGKERSYRCPTPTSRAASTKPSKPPVLWYPVRSRRWTALSLRCACESDSVLFVGRRRGAGCANGPGRGRLAPGIVPGRTEAPRRSSGGRPTRAAGVRTHRAHTGSCVAPTGTSTCAGTSRSMARPGERLSTTQVCPCLLYKRP